jgi:hypothetical protein
MPRTKDLRKVRDAFLEDVGDGEQAWGDANASARRKTVAEDIFLRFAVAWENFLSEWFIGAINHDATRFKRTLERRMREWLTREVQASPYAAHASAFSAPSMTLSRNPTVARVRELLDPGEGNIEFRTYEELRSRSRAQLAPRFVARVETLAGAGEEMMEATIAIRNTLSHRSQKATRLMNERIAAFPSYPMLRKPTMSKDGIGTYLGAATPGGEARLLVFSRELGRIASVLVP